jgi:hypothetical protein
MLAPRGKRMKDLAIVDVLPAELNGDQATFTATRQSIYIIAKIYCCL